MTITASIVAWTVYNATFVCCCTNVALHCSCACSMMVDPSYDDQQSPKMAFELQHDEAK